MRRVSAIALLLLLAGGPALAQTAQTPVMGTSAAGDAKADLEPQALTRVLVLGDAVGGGLGAGLMRMGEADGHYDVTLRFNEESGLARPEVYDWVATLPKILENSSYDVIVVLIGTNDRQMIRSGNERFAFNTPQWIAAYARQIDLLLDTLKSSGARIYWIGMPPMADAEYDAAMQVVSTLQKERAGAKGVSFLDFRGNFLTADGRYTDSGPDDTGAIRKLRGRDGVSFFKQGNNRLGQLVLQAIQGGVEATPVAAESKAPEAGPVQAVRQVPLFGQTGLLGESVLLQPDDVTVSAGLVLAAGGEVNNPAAVLAAIRSMAQPGSAAEKLFTRGEVAATPKGRADDFAVTPLASD